MANGNGSERWEVIRRSSLITLIDAITLDDDPTSYNSSAQAVDEWRHFLLYLDVDSTGTPTTVRFILQFSDDEGTTWYSYLQGLFASLYYEDQDTASGIKECFSGDVVGRDLRLRAVGTGTSASNSFTITAKLELYS